MANFPLKKEDQIKTVNCPIGKRLRAKIIHFWKILKSIISLNDIKSFTNRSCQTWFPPLPTHRYTAQTVLIPILRKRKLWKFQKLVIRFYECILSNPSCAFGVHSSSTEMCYLPWTLQTMHRRRVTKPVNRELDNCALYWVRPSLFARLVTEIA